MRRRPLALLVCSLLIALLFHAPPASAESGHKDKKVGDAPAAIDITRISANNAARRVKVSLEVPGLTEQGKFTIGYENDRYDGMAIVLRHPGSQVTWKVFHCGEESCTRVDCPGLKARWSVADRIVSASVPQKCYPFNVPDAWNFIGNSDLGKKYDSDYTRLRLARG